MGDVRYPLMTTSGDIKRVGTVIIDAASLVSYIENVPAHTSLRPVTKDGQLDSFDFVNESIPAGVAAQTGATPWAAADDLANLIGQAVGHLLADRTTIGEIRVASARAADDVLTHLAVRRP